MLNTIPNAKAVYCSGEVWPDAIERGLQVLPKRCLFRNDRVTVLLAGLQQGEVLTLGPWQESQMVLVHGYGLTSSGEFPCT